MRANTTHIETLVIGGGQAGLAVGYHLAKRGLPFLILDASQRTGDAWRNRWDSLRLFTPARYSSLPGYPFPKSGDAAPTKHEMADYLESYAKRFHLRVQSGVRVDKLSQSGDEFQAIAGDQRFEAKHVVIAMANYQKPRVPSFAGELDPEIVQIHSHDYKNPAQLRDGPTLIVGVGNSGADIGLEVARTHKTWLSGKESGSMPYHVDSFMARFLVLRLVRFIGHHILTVSTPMGRRMRPKMLHRATPLIRVKPEDLTNAGIERVGRVAGVRDGKPLLDDGRTLDAANVIWCTGYHPGFSWIDLPVFDESGDPAHERGIVTRVPGLYFVGLHYLYSMTSGTITGVGRDAERVVRTIESRVRLARTA
jgi:putative flavoprotein involved in K+ transport